MGSFYIHVLTKDGLPNAHATAPMDFLSSRLLGLCLFQALRHARRRQPSAKQSSCGDGPAESAASSKSSSLPRRSSRRTFKKDSTNSTGDRAEGESTFHWHVPVNFDSKNTFAPCLERLCEFWMIRQPYMM